MFSDAMVQRSFQKRSFYAAMSTALTRTSDGSNSCRQFASDSLQATLKRPALPGSEACPGFEDRRGQYVLQARLDKTFYLYGPHSLDACEHLRLHWLASRHIDRYCSCPIEQCPDPNNSDVIDWSADILEITTSWPTEIPPLPPKDIDPFAVPSTDEGKLTKPQQQLAKELRNVLPIANFAIFRPPPQDTPGFEPGPRKKKKPQQISISQLFSRPQ